MLKWLCSEAVCILIWYRCTSELFCEVFQDGEGKAIELLELYSLHIGNVSFAELPPECQGVFFTSPVFMLLEQFSVCCTS